MKKIALFAIFSAFMHAAVAEPANKIVSLGGSVTEIIYDLGMGDKLIANDISSLYPEEATKLPRVGYYRAISVEGVASMKPDLILASENAGPKKALDNLEQLGMDITRVSDQPNIDSLYERVGQVAQALSVEEKGRELVEKIRWQVSQAQAIKGKNLKTVLVVNRTGNIQAAGRDTAASALIKLAGLNNILEESQKGYKPVSAEALLNLGPELIIVTEGSLQASGGMEKFISHPAIAATPAAMKNQIVVMDDLLALGLGPRIGQAIEQLKSASNAAH